MQAPEAPKEKKEEEHEISLFTLRSAIRVWRFSEFVVRVFSADNSHEKKNQEGRRGKATISGTEQTKNNACAAPSRSKAGERASFWCPCQVRAARLYLRRR